MMACDSMFRGKEGEDVFSDSREELSSVFDSCPGSPATSHVSLGEENSVKLLNDDSLYQVWIRSPGSIQERRAKFMKYMGLDPIHPDDELMTNDTIVGDLDSNSTEYGAVFRKCSSERFEEVACTSLGRSSGEQFERRTENSEDGVFVARDSNQNGSFLRGIPKKTSMRKNFAWLRRLGSMACIVDRQGYLTGSALNDSDERSKARFQRVQVHLNRKQSKEFSALYMGQNFKAHNGAILTMKFSPDGEHIASGGEDGVVRVWQVMERPRNSNLYADSLKNIRSMNFCGTSDSAHVIVPPEVFEVSEKALHEFHGHKGDVLDLAWSKDKCLLSSSVDKTVRLWQLGCDGCLKVFAHSDYVPCVQFNPMDEKYFVSGSIDGKVRIWEIPTCRVVNWTDAKQIVTAICYCPDGKGVVVGSIMGDCRFYVATDDDLQLSSMVSFVGKKKSFDKRITGFQFCPTCSSRLMVTSADSVIRILEGVNVVSKYKGFHNTGSKISATFTPNGEHIVSASKDSNVYIWNHMNQTHIPSTNSKSIKSFERFASSNTIRPIRFYTSHFPVI
ncbi:WD repeat-containing protein 44-like isoform X2 [Phalaenopsis equestris]|uniref:WD repeat-containing protein 44-like isoform X2 n=1 Tax=Phalaenopsis equestris TaxID=78828 RepID=UPI0009E5A5DC|nr:WD repeat-containing protein 44-like isoform X2 [Phalaenopsis equestris]